MLGLGCSIATMINFNKYTRKNFPLKRKILSKKHFTKRIGCGIIYFALTSFLGQAFFLTLFLLEIDDDKRHRKGCLLL